MAEGGGGGGFGKFFECEGRVKPGLTYPELLFSLNEEKRYWKNRYIHRVYSKCQGPLAGL